MEAQRRQILVALLMAGDALVLAGAYASAFTARFPHRFAFSADTPNGAHHVVLGMSALALWVLIAAGLGLYRPHILRAPGATLARVLVGLLLVGLLTGTVLFFVKADLATRLVLALMLAFALPPLWLERVLARRVLTAWGARRNPLVLVLGTGAAARGLGERLVAEPMDGYRLAGYVRLDTEPAAVPAHEIVGDADGLERLLDERVVDLVALAHPAASLAQIDEIARVCHEVGRDLVLVGGALGALVARATLESLGDSPALRLAGSRRLRTTMIGKRVFDLALGLFLLGLATPLLVLLAVLVRLTSPGRALYAQERVGVNGRTFRLYKLRSMVADAESRRAALEPMNEVPGPVFKLRDDPRLTPLGRFLRRFSLDELPQLVNVVKGDMSLVGPRPPLPHEVARYDRWQRRRLSVRPGLTGVWQVGGRSDVDFETWMRLDLAYIDHWSPWLDLKILAKTVPVVLSGRGAC